MRRVRIADVGRNAGILRRIRHTPAHHRQLALALIDADDRRELIREDCGKRRQVAGGVSRDPEEIPDRGLIRYDAVEVTH